MVQMPRRILRTNLARFVGVSSLHPTSCLCADVSPLRELCAADVRPVLRAGEGLHVVRDVVCPARSTPAWAPIVPVPHCRLLHTRMLRFYIFALLYIPAERVGVDVGRILSGVQWTSLSRQLIASPPPPPIAPPSRRSTESRFPSYAIIIAGYLFTQVVKVSG